MKRTSSLNPLDLSSITIYSTASAYIVALVTAFTNSTIKPPLLTFSAV